MAKSKIKKKRKTQVSTLNAHDLIDNNIESAKILNHVKTLRSIFPRINNKALCVKKDNKDNDNENTVHSIIQNHNNYYKFTQKYLQQNICPTEDELALECYGVIESYLKTIYRQGYRAKLNKKQQLKNFILESNAKDKDELNFNTKSDTWIKIKEPQQKSKKGNKKEPEKEDISFTPEIVDELLAIDDSFRTYYDSYKYEWKYEETSLKGIFSCTFFWESYISNLYLFQKMCEEKNCLDADKKRLINEKLASATSLIEDIFISAGFTITEIWQNYEKQLYSHISSERMYFCDIVVDLCSQRDNDLKNLIITAISDGLLNWIQGRFSVDKTLKLSLSSTEIGTNYKQYIYTNLFQDKEELTIFIINVYKLFRTMASNYICSILIDRYYEVSKGASDSLKKEISEYRKKENKYLKDISRLTKTVEKLEAGYKDISENAKLKMENAVKNALKEKSDETLALRKELKNAQDEINRLTFKCNKMENQSKESRPEDTSVSDENISYLSSYLKLRNMRLVFVRSKFSEDYVIFKELSKAFPNAKYVDTISNDYNVNNVDCIVIMIKCIKHNAYHKVKDNAKVNGVPIVHCNYNNLDMVTRTILQVL